MSVIDENGYYRGGMIIPGMWVSVNALSSMAAQLPNIDLTGKRAVVVGRSLVIGKPVSLMLIGENATVTVCHTKTKDLAGELKAADIIVASAGVAKMITSDMVSPGQVIIDVGMNTDENGNLCGDVDYEGVSGIVDSITPVPGGVGAVTTSVLLKNTVEGAFRINHDKL